MKTYTYLLSLIIVLFLSCKSANNCILNLSFQRELESPGPDLITFNLTSNEKEFENLIENYGLIEVVFNNNKSFKTDVFEIIKINDNTYKLDARSPYFSIIDYYTDEQIFILFNQSKEMIINITLNDKTFVFTKCKS